MNENLEAVGTGSRPHVDWASILAGAAIAAGASVVFTGFTAAIGLGSVSAEPGEGLGTFALILVGLFAFASMVAVYGLGGYVSGRMRRRTWLGWDWRGFLKTSLPSLLPCLPAQGLALGCAVRLMRLRRFRAVAASGLRQK